jgi:DNA-binding IclR family transcriptional regulator
MPASITSRRELMRELTQVRQGYALNWEESSEGVAAVALAPDVRYAAKLIHEQLLTASC